MENRRRREDDALSLESPTSKRHREAAILEILDGDDEVAGGAGRWGDDLNIVMRSLEQEIALASPTPAAAASPPPELGYLLAASDDELGIPPSEGDEERRIEELEAAAALWFADDEISSGYCYDGLGLGFVRYGEDGGCVTVEEDEVAEFDCAPFDYARDLGWTV